MDISYKIEVLKNTYSEQPTAGTVETKGRVTALLELGASFRPELTRPGEHLTVGTLGRPGRWLCRGDGIKYAHLTQEKVK